MASQITLASNFTALLDEAYRAASVTGDLNTNDATILASANAGEVKVPKMTVDGLADYLLISSFCAPVFVKLNSPVFCMA